MKKKLVVGVGALVAAQIFSGCYFLREINWNPDLAPKRESTKATISLQSSDEAEPSYFFLGETGKGDGFAFKRPVFDSKDLTGQKQKLIVDEEIGEFLDACQTFSPPVARGAGAPTIWRTEDEVSDTDPEKFVELKLKAERASNVAGGYGGLIITGQWIDDGDGVVEDPESTEDQFACTGEATTTFLLKGQEP